MKNGFMRETPSMWEKAVFLVLLKKTPMRLDPWEIRDWRLAYWFLNIYDEIEVPSFLFNFLSFPFSNQVFLILLSCLPSGAPLCPRAHGPRGWHGALGVLKITSGFGGSGRRFPPKKPNLLYIYHIIMKRLKNQKVGHHPPSTTKMRNLLEFYFRKPFKN